MKLTDIIKEYPTPFYLYHARELKDTLEQIRTMLPEVGICYAMKAAPILISVLGGITDRIECCSPGEYEICKRAGISPKKLFISGVNKTRESLERVMETAGQDPVFTIESAHQLRLLEEITAERKVRAGVYIRLSSGNQFGVDEEAFWELSGKVRQSPGLKLLGVHYFSGTQKQEKRIEKELALLAEMGRKAREKTGEKLSLEYGPGLLVDYFSGIDTAEKRAEAREKTLNMLAAAAESSGIRSCWEQITFEYGRFIAAWAGDYLTSVADLKVTEEKAYCILDGGLHQISYFGSMSGMKIPPVELCGRTEKNGLQTQMEEYLLAGSLCSSNDVLVRKILLPKLEIGDVLRFKLAGAYSLTESMALFLSRDLPAVLMEEDGRISVMRPGQLTDGINDGSVELQERKGR